METSRDQLIRGMQAHFTPRSNARKALANVLDEFLLSEKGQALLADVLEEGEGHGS